LSYTELLICYGTKELTTSSKFGLSMTKTSDKLSYLTSQLQGSFCKLITDFYNLSFFNHVYFEVLQRNKTTDVSNKINF